MNLVYGIITCNRPDYFAHNISTFIETIVQLNNWRVFIGDDSSKEPSYVAAHAARLNKLGIETTVIKTCRRGPHYLVNRILQAASRLDFDYGFMAEDDVYFVRSGWYKNYVKASERSSFDYLCYFNSTWAKNHGRGACVRPIQRDTKLHIQSEVGIYESFGCFWTFTPALIKGVGYFDMENFGVWGNGHTDYSMRCCRSGHNGIANQIYDALDSNAYLQMQDTDYRSSYGGRRLDSSLVGVPDGRHKGQHLDRNKINYVPYNEIKLDMSGEVVE